MAYLNRIIGLIKEIFFNIPYRELLVGVLAGILITALVISYTKYKQTESIFLLLKKEIQTNEQTVKTVSADKKLGAPLLLNTQVPNKYWETLTNDEFNLLDACDQHRTIANFYTHLDILRVYYDLVARMLTNGQYPLLPLQKSIEQEQKIILSLSTPAIQATSYCRDRLILNRLKRGWYLLKGKV